MADGSHFEPTSAALSWLNRLTTDLCPCILDVGLKLGGFKIISAMESFEFTDSSERKALGFSGHSEEEPCLRVVAERKE